ncbi:MAG: Asp/Glu/hydantoin racemase [Candidatus Entotheonella factor]|uniref:Asp/Glu/hydantoin racemase n=1 Tax=Entotheonella factor TaxID=1429438 RepID=W4LMV8_ENTF1|nr:aspartate/glutamate racemase family protein [Candidatus Entotheonella palauensis]ETW98716.1 MAG: Asp/Glu/hydantoin racemase [Candidatus Entotheonella factor]
MPRTRLGMLTPSSNTVVEPVTTDIIRALPDVTAHFARFTVTEISLTQQALDQFTPEPFLQAAQQLADARMHVIAWNGTSAAWKGFDQDDALCGSIREQFGVPATASMQALNAILDATEVRRFALVTPYIDAVQEHIVTNYMAAGYTIAAERHIGISENFAFSEIPGADIADMVRAVAVEQPEAIMIVCTNLNSAQLVDELERELQIPIYDSLSAVVWHALKLAGVDPAPITGWGRLFQRQIL